MSLQACPAPLRQWRAAGPLRDAINISNSFPSSNQVSAIRLAYGFGRAELYRSLLIIIAFFLVPIGVTLWMRQAALESGKTDPTAAWFSYFRTINWCINGSMLLWITSGLEARQTLQDYLRFAFPSSWESAVLDVAMPRAGNGLAAHIYAGFGCFWGWSQNNFVLIVAGLAAFYFLSRRYEHAPDESTVLLTGDPEAQITGLLKLSRLNLMPIQLGKGTGSWLTHPSTVRRAERIAAASGMSAEQLQLILERYRSEMQLGADAVAPASVSGYYYAVPEATDPESVRSTATKRHRNQFVLWIGLLAHVIPPALVAAFINVTHGEGNEAIALYLFGFAFTPLFCVMTSVWLGVSGRHALRARLAQRFQREGFQGGRFAGHPCRIRARRGHPFLRSELLQLGCRLPGALWQPSWFRRRASQVLDVGRTDRRFLRRTRRTELVEISSHLRSLDPCGW